MLEESLGEYEMLDEAFEDLGDISGSETLDIGTGGGSMVSYLVRRKGLERVFAIDLFTGTLGLLKKQLSSEDLLKVILIKADLRRLDFLRDDFFDLVTAYDTLCVIEKYTPGGTDNVLNEVHRILKPEGCFIAIERFPLNLVKPVDEAQKVEARFVNLHFKLSKALHDPSSVEYTPQSLVKTIGNSGFEVSHWKELKTRYIEAEPGETEFLPHTVKRIQKVSDEKLREGLLEEIMQIEKALKEYGMRSIPNFVVYAKKSLDGEQGEVEVPSLRKLYETVSCRDLLGY